MSIKRYEPNGKFSKVVEHNGILYVSGLLANTKEGDISVQAKEALENITKAVERYGSDNDHILSCTVFLKHMSDFAGMNQVWENWVSKENQPTRACVEANLAAPEWLIEVAAVAVVK